MSATAARADQLTRFRPGLSGNPRGRPRRDFDIAELARAFTPEALKTLADIMMDKGAPPAARVSAANSLLDRGLGKPPRSLHVHYRTTLADEFEQFIWEFQANRTDKAIEAQAGHD